ncbi:MAG: hypothetical protein ACAI44_11195 [Candidatus Sericytochromatia bacterium]
MGGPVSSSPPPDPRLQLNAAVFNQGATAGAQSTTSTTPTDPATAPDSDPAAQPLILTVPATTDWNQQSRGYERLNFDQQVSFELPPESHGPVLESSDGTHYGIKGGKATVTRDLEVMGNPAQLRFQASPRKGGSVGMEFKMPLGGR